VGSCGHDRRQDVDWASTYLGRKVRDSVPWVINERNQIVGTAESEQHDPTPAIFWRLQHWTC